MSINQLSSATTIIFSTGILKRLQQLNLDRTECEEVFFNLPKVQKLITIFNDHHDRLLIEGETDRGKHLRLVIYIDKSAIHITYINRV
jgi:hypothetical protein